MDDSELAVKSRTQLAQIDALQKQINGLQSLSTMGAAILRKGQRSPSAVSALSAVERPPIVTFSTGTSSTLERQVIDQAEQIDKLRGELMTARSQSSIAEYTLNKWRPRSY
jgi:hypothetical protein